MTMSFAQVKVKRESSVSPPGWEHSSEEDQPLDFSRHQSSDESPTNKSKPTSPIVVPKPLATYLNAQTLPLSPQSNSPQQISSEHSEIDGQTDLRSDRLKVPQPIRFHTSPPRISPGAPPITADLLNSNFNALYGFAYSSLQPSPEALQGNPALLDPSYLHFRQQVLLQKMQQTVTAQRRKPSTTAVVPTSTSPTSPTPLLKSSEPSSELSDHSNDSQINSTSKSTNGSNSAAARRRGKAFPDELKDEAYWERRRKNNEAAKRSRDARRAKEDEIAIRAAYLEQENLKLRVEVAALKSELQKMRCLMYAS